ncbi:MAG: LysR family transcriptional regulator [Rhodocyclaceae bacterium]|nr:LysR family transcriptional regulator [Rhodocyclaceae bacterium]
MKLFISVVEEGTIAAAAAREHIAAAAVSRRLADLEGVLRTSLLNRTNKGVEPTAAGITLVNLARRALHELDDIAVQMADYASGARGHVRVFANISAITQFLPGEIKGFRERYPQVQIHLEEKISSVVTRAVADNAADLGIYTAGPHAIELETFPYHADRLVLIAPKDHPLAQRRRVCFAETLDFDYVGLHTGSAINLQLTKAASEIDRTVRLAIQVTSYDALCVMVGAGLGIGLLPEALARLNARMLGIRAIRLEDAWAGRELRICVRAFDALPVAARLLVNHLRLG